MQAIHQTTTQPTATYDYQTEPIARFWSLALKQRSQTSVGAVEITIYRLKPSNDPS